MRQMKLVLVSVLCLFVVSGCGKWREKYQACNAENENLRALFDGCQQELAQCQSDKNNLMRMMQDQSAAPEPSQTPPGWETDAARGTTSVTVASDLLFSSGKATLKSGIKSKLNEIAGIINQKYPGNEVWVIGHTDTDPIKKSKWKDNWQLSTERSLAVTRYLIGKGVSASNTVAGGRGQHHPIGSSKSQNRRVEIVVHMW
jgi:flagellar motor protein MotB